MTEWLVRQGQSEPIGPVSTDLVLKGIRAGRVSPHAQVCRVGDNHWVPISSVRELGGVPVDDDAETNVTDKPWFATQTAIVPSRPRPGHPSRPSHPDRPSGLGLSAPRRELISSPSHSRPRPPLPPPPQSTTLVAGQSRYDEEDDDAATRVAAPHDELAAPPDYQVDDETMTRVARPPGGAPADAAQRAPAKNVLPTMPMSQVLERGPVASPRPAAGMPPMPAPHDVLPPTQPFGPHAQGGAPFVMPGAFPPVAGMPPTQPPMQMQIQVPHGTVPPMTPQQPWPPQYPQPPAPEPHASADQGLRALVALIVFLAVALAIVVLLLVIRR